MEKKYIKLINKHLLYDWRYDYVHSFDDILEVHRVNANGNIEVIGSKQGIMVVGFGKYEYIDTKSIYVGGE